MSEEKDPQAGRRTFCKVCIGGMAAASVGMVAYPIVSFLAPAEQLGSNKPMEITLEKLSVGQAQYVDFRGQQLILLMAQEGPQIFNASCPHLGCNVIWESAKAIFRCPCHGAVFDADGKVVRGPVSSPLAKVPFQLKDGKIVLS
jgi:Rieske Fe-S protein